LCCFDDPSPSQRVTHTTGMTHLKVHIQVYLKILSSNRQSFILRMFYNYHFLMSVPWIRCLINCHSHWTSGFNPRAVQIEFVVDRVALGKFFSQVLCFSLVVFILSLLRPHSFIWCWCCIILGTGSPIEYHIGNYFISHNWIWFQHTNIEL